MSVCYRPSVVAEPDLFTVHVMLYRYLYGIKAMA